MIRNFGLSMQKKDTQMQRWRKREAAWTIMLNVLDGFCCWDNDEFCRLKCDVLYILKHTLCASQKSNS